MHRLLPLLRPPVWIALLLVLFACTPVEAPPFDGQAAHAHVVTQVNFGPRTPGTEGHRRCADWLAAELTKYTETVKRQTFYHVLTKDSLADTMHLFNIIASFVPDNPRRLAICAHWDSRPWSDEDPDTLKRSLPVPGANDGGSGVAICLELARLLGAAPPPCGVDLILFDAEDQGPRGRTDEYLIGSRWFVSQARQYRPVAVILLDMVGDAQLNISREGFSDSLAPGLVDLVWGVADSLGLSGFVDTVGYHVIDDHLPFLLNGIPAIDLIDFQYTQWHTASDTPEWVSAESLEQVGRLLRHLIYHTPLEEIQRAARLKRR
jgi:peptidase M28-like protein